MEGSVGTTMLLVAAAAAVLLLLPLLLPPLAPPPSQLLLVPVALMLSLLSLAFLVPNRDVPAARWSDHFPRLIGR